MNSIRSLARHTESYEHEHSLSAIRTCIEYTEAHIYIGMHGTWLYMHAAARMGSEIQISRSRQLHGCLAGMAYSNHIKNAQEASFKDVLRIGHSSYESPKFNLTRRHSVAPPHRTWQVLVDDGPRCAASFLVPDKILPASPGSARKSSPPRAAAVGLAVPTPPLFKTLRNF